ncbi:MAG TPA: gamma-glutamyl-gamma-aminobutyrate hydrolase [Arthrobacter bacterium]|nr:gamma-glutamyl-gamma-aminobutyrate hydrolase [Arthrobacter sp.]HAP91343.1 gamma-glutamyl-gamma-aminobutyrate hydrolase [Arthrobacter sp.]HBH59775.1 gamma-glutamyl-gamma-aminobutyrate hydrolase [Arthrobacter sp.]HCB57977.1 gamma-glutamyl-gamma-aminobutyrate hydrolase [Arthrobacter sp.]HCC40619.1 gamma-glutamyl-gamma-aminobutyrate hydrolase [Arthrobacter sp.]
MASNGSETYRPRIALTSYYQEASWGVWNAPAAILPGTYVEAVVAAGGTPLLLPPVGTDTSVLDLVDGLIVVGGPDVEPSLYGAAPHPKTKPQPLRDAHDAALTGAALERGLPLFAICRGAQILDVALGGSLIQHVPDVNPEANYQPAPGVFGEAAFSTTPGSLIRELLGDTATAPCYHHQCIDSVPEGLRVTARSDDGTVQALETSGDGWVLGVQFHPEQNPEDLRLFRGFVEAAAGYRLSSTHHPATHNRNAMSAS